MPKTRPDGTPLSIVHLCAPAHVGGLERVVQGLSMGLAERGHQVAVVAVVQPADDTAPFLDPIESTGVECIRIDAPGRGYLRELREVGRLLDRRQPDVLHTHGYRPDLLHGHGARRRGIATVTTLHGSSRMGGFSQIFEWVQEKALARFDAVVAVSTPLVESLLDRGVLGDQIHEVPNAWTPPEGALERAQAREILDVASSDLVIGWVGRLIPVKGADVFLRALDRLPCDGWTARIIGDGPERPALEALNRELGLSGRVRFLGAIPDADRLLSGMDVFALSSRSEGTPMVVLEAMGAGVPVLATAVGGVPDLLDQGRAGSLVEPDAPDAMAETLAEILASPELRAAHARCGTARIRSVYSLDRWIDRHEEVYAAARATRRSGNG